MKKLLGDCGPKNDASGDWSTWGDCRLSASP